MATESELRPDSGDPPSEERASNSCQKSEFDMDNLSKPELLTLLSILEGELEARDLVIETLRSRRKDVFIQERYGRFNLSDPFLALQRDYEAGGGAGSDGSKDKPSICTSPLSILEVVMGHCKKMQERMSAQLAAAEIRHRKVILDFEEERHKHAQDAAQGDDVTYMLEKERERLLQQVEFEKSQLKQLEAENKKLSMQFDEERIKNKQLVMMLVKECKQLAGKVVDESQTLAEITKTLDEEQTKTTQLEEELVAEKKKSLQMEAKMEKQLSEFDIEREQLRAKLNREENSTKDLRLEVESFKKTVELNCTKEGGTTSLTSNLNKDLTVGYVKQTMLSIASQTETFVDIASENNTKKTTLTVPVKPSTMNPLSAGGTKLNMSSNTALVKPIGDKLPPTTNSEEIISTTQTKVVPCSLENGPSVSTGPVPLSGALPHLVGSTSLVLSNTIVPSPPSGTSSPCSSPGATMQSLSSPSTTLQPGLSPRIQAARFKFQAQTVDQEKHASVAAGSSSRDLSPTNRDNSPAKQLARNTVSQVLSRFTGPPSIVKPCTNSASPFGTENRNLTVSNLKPGLAHPATGEGSSYPQVVGKITSSLSVSPAGLKSPTGARVDRGNPPPIPPKKPGLSQTPSSPHPPLKVFMDGSRSPTVGFNTRIEGRTVASPSSSPHPGIKGTSEEVLSKTALPQLPPKPVVDIASAGCAVPAVAASQVGAQPSLSPELNQTACSECSLIITTIASRTSIDLASTTKRNSSTRPCDTDNLLITPSAFLLTEGCAKASMTSAISFTHLANLPPNQQINGRSPSLTPLLMSGGPVPLGGRSTLLHQAAAQGNVTLLSMLLNEDGIDINHPDEEGSSALYSAAKNGYTESVTFLLTSGAQVDDVGKNLFTPLCAAAAQGHVGCTEVLIAYGANINYAAQGDQTPLYLSCVNGHIECTLTLLEAGADCSIMTVDGWAPFHAAVSSGHVDCLKLLMYHQVSGGRMFTDDSEHISGSVDPAWAEGSDESTVEPMISADLINQADKEGWTAAHIAASKGFKNCLEVLCCHKGLDPDRKDNCQRTVHDVATDDCKHLLENWNAHKVLLQISMKHSETVCSSTEHIENNITIGSLIIRKLTTWDDLSKTVTVTLKNHFKTVMNGWESSDASTFLNNTEYSFISSGISAVEIGLQEGSLDSMAYASLIPVCILQNYVRLVEQYHNVIFHGPVGSCQDHIAHQIANGIKHKLEAVGSSCEIIQIEMETSSSKDQLVELFIQSGILVPLRQSTVTEKATVILIENLETAASLSEFLGELLDALENRGVGNPFTFQHANGTSDTYYFQENSFLIGTMAKVRLQSSDLMVQQHFRWVQLRWDVEPISGLLQRFLKRQIIHKFQGQLPPPTDPACKAVQWVCTAWRQLNSYLARLGTPEALMGPRDFFSCPILPGQVQPIMKWMANLWNNVIAPRAEEVILSRASAKRPSRQGQPVKKIVHQGQQAVVKAALSILLNKAVLHGCSLSRQEFEQYAPKLQGWSFPLTMISNCKTSKKVDSNAWRKVSTGPRKKSAHSVSQSWSKFEGQREGIQLMPELPKSFNKLNTQVKLHSLESGPLKTADLEQGLSLYTSEDIDIIEELQSMCLSKSESDISKIDVSRDLLFLIPDFQSDQSSLKMLKDHYPAPLPAPEVSDCTLTNGTPRSSSSIKKVSRSGISRVKSHLPVLLNNTHRIHRSNSNTRHSESNNNSTTGVWNLGKTLHEANKK